MVKNCKILNFLVKFFINLLISLYNIHILAPIDGLTVFNFVTNQQMPLVIVHESAIKDEDQPPFYMDCRLGSSLFKSTLDRSISKELAIGNSKNAEMTDQEILNLAEVFFFFFL